MGFETMSRTSSKELVKEFHEACLNLIRVTLAAFEQGGKQSTRNSERFEA